MFKGPPKASRAADLPILPPVPITSGVQPSPSDAHIEDYSTFTRSENLGNIKSPRHRFLTSAEWSILAHGVGGVKDSEQHAPVHPTCWLWPPKGLPPGLYKDIILLRTQSFYRFHIASFIRWGLMILQLFLGATLTALGSFNDWNGTPVTVLGAANTIVAGILALIHNSGIPDRYRYDMAEYEEVEDHIKQMLETGIVLVDKAIDQALAECYDMYHNAKATVGANMPVTYNSSQALQAGGRSVAMMPHRLASPPRLPRVMVDANRDAPLDTGK
ncbi:Fc.00g090060.m01.CDS01 [Cosmosporella sp. VM-42]